MPSFVRCARLREREREREGRERVNEYHPPVTGSAIKAKDGCRRNCAVRWFERGMEATS